MDNTKFAIPFLLYTHLLLRTTFSIARRRDVRSVAIVLPYNTRADHFTFLIPVPTVFLSYAHYRMSRSTAAVLPGSTGHADEPYEDDENELTAAQIAEHARIRAGINARLVALKAEANAIRSVSASGYHPSIRGPRSSGVGPRLTKKQTQAAALEKRRATLAAKAKAAAAAADDEDEDEDEGEEEGEEGKAEGGAGSGPAANYVAAAAARYAASGLPAARKGSVRFFDMANTRNVNRHNGKVLIRNRNTRKSTAGKPVTPAVNIRRSRHAANISALFAKMSSWAVAKDPGYLTKILSHIKKEPRYLDAHLTPKEKEVLETPGTLAQLERQAAMMNKE